METRIKRRNIFNGWWLTVDRWLLLSTVFIMIIGAILIATASPSVAEKISRDQFYFVERQLIFLILSFCVMFVISLLPTDLLKKASVVGFGVFIIFLLLLPFLGTEIKGSVRWLYIAGMSIQPSEFVKPFFIVVTALVLTHKSRLIGYKVSALLYFLLVGLLVLQPDIGMTAVVTFVWGGQLLISGIPWIIVGGLIAIAVLGFTYIYNAFPHVSLRIKSFLDPEAESYQVKKSLEAFSGGGVFGKGPGEGVVKQHLPDSHTDFIFAVAGEEMGFLVCMLIVLLFAIVVIRSFVQSMRNADLFSVYAISGLAMQFGVQAIVNMGVTLKLLPTKGMTLPFISYGGSSLIALSITIGMLLSFTRKRYGSTNILRSHG